MNAVRKVALLVLLALVLPMLSMPSLATSWGDKELKCPICGTKGIYSVILTRIIHE